MPPASARAIAILYSVTVSIAADNSGKLISIFFVRRVFTDAWLGRKSQYEGTRSTSSKVRALAFTLSMQKYNKRFLRKK
jgi:hypothetical protein